ncbi:hypothetical protein QQS21_000775 [Conoideocrella luteorostrata]|uniref:Uncharacterized protein n=1 Tax=Conoideocrella luteorostrata TaxID=1105319 RepID=A0AAJ0G2J5_9HYPO|nr:hypothetical protein QQS21_000775 [Conoideocrella luteorostrata]
MFNKVSLLALLLPLVSADDASGRSGNLTVAFFPDDQDAACQSSDTSKGLVLTTNSLPTTYTCFNTSDIFSQGNNTGFKKNIQTVYDGDGKPIEPNGIYWLLHNKELYDAKANYSRAWYQQVNISGKIEEGQPAPWIFKVFPFADCKDAGGDDKPYKEWPWFESTCQTGSKGSCRPTPHPILSFSIGAARDGSKSQCSTWAFRGDATAAGGTSSWVALCASLLALFLLI